MYSTDSGTVRAVQNALRKRHYYAVEVDGFEGQATGDAIQRFQIAHGLRVRPVIDPSLLRALGIGSSDNLSLKMVQLSANKLP